MGIGTQFTLVATDLIAKLGYGGLAIGLIVDSAGVPIPSEVLLPLSGALIRQGKFNFVAILVVATISQTIGAVIAYELGARGGLPLVKRFGKYVLFNERELLITQKWFGKYGSWLTLFGRCLPVIRTYIGYPAGIAKMPRTRFVAASMIGSFIWSAILTYAGYALFANLVAIDHLLRRFSVIILCLLVILVIWYCVKHLKGKRA